MSKSNKLLLIAVALIFALALVFGQAPLQAESVAASDGGGASVESEYEPGQGGWTVGDGDGNQDVYYDPDAGPWMKILTIGQPAAQGHIFTLTENLHVGNGPDGLAPAWTDYHEDILTPGWTWSPNGPAGEQWNFTSPSWSGSWVYAIPSGNTKVDWRFNPSLPFCTDLTITKYLVYNGGVGADPSAPIIIASTRQSPSRVRLSCSAWQASVRCSSFGGNVGRANRATGQAMPDILIVEATV